MLRQARRKMPDIVWVHGDSAALPFASGSFDFISSQYAFHPFRDMAGMLREAFRVLRRGGQFALYNMCSQESDDWLYYAYLYSMGTGEPHAAGLVRGLARGRFIIGDKASVYAEIARSREPSNAAAELGLRRFAHGKPGRAPPSGGYDATAKLAQPAARVLDPHRILPYCVSRAQKQLSYLTAMVRAQQQERKQAARLTRGP